jgi:prephenate dehydratase
MSTGRSAGSSWVLPMVASGDRVRVAYQGEPGAFSEDAVGAAFPDAEAIPCRTIRAAFGEVTSGRTEAAVLPMENSQAGSINETYDLLLRSESLRILGEMVVRVDHALMGIPGARLEDVRRVFSHPQALAQCDEFLLELEAETIAVHDTAGAARMVAEEGRLDHAAVAGVRAAELTGLAVLAERIQTYPENATKFAVVGDPEQGALPNLGRPEKTSMVFVVADRPGSLYRALQPLAERNINLTKLESRPRRGAPFDYVFYVDLSAPLDQPEVEEALEEVRRHTSMLKALGSYPVLRP